MTYKDTNPTYNVNRNIVNFKDFNKESEESELSKIKRSYKKNELEIGQKERKYKYNKVTHKLDDMDRSEVEDKLDSMKESIKSLPITWETPSRDDIGPGNPDIEIKHICEKINEIIDEVNSIRYQISNFGDTWTKD